MSRIYVGDKPVKAVMIGGKKYVAKGRTDSRVPAIFQRLEFIESTGAQYIDTGISGGTNAAYEIKFNPLTISKNYETYFGGDRVMPVPKLIYEDGINAQVINESDTNTQNILTSYGAGLNMVSTIGYSNTIITCNGIQIPTQGVAGAGWGNLPVCIARSKEETTLYATMRLYYLKMWTDGILVRNFIPVKCKTTNIVGLWDTVSRTFFTDGNGGNFIGGDPV